MCEFGKAQVLVGMDFVAGAQKCYVTSTRWLSLGKDHWPSRGWVWKAGWQLREEAVISWSRLIWLWCFWRRTTWPGWWPLVTERVLTLSERTFIHLSMPALPNAVSTAGVWNRREGAAQVCLKGHLHHFSSKTTDGTSKCMAGCIGLPWKCPGADGGLAHSSVERSGGQGGERGGGC